MSRKFYLQSTTCPVPQILSPKTCDKLYCTTKTKIICYSQFHQKISTSVWFNDNQLQDFLFRQMILGTRCSVTQVNCSTAPIISWGLWYEHFFKKIKNLKYILRKAFHEIFCNTPNSIFKKRSKHMLLNSDQSASVFISSTLIRISYIQNIIMLGLKYKENITK